MIRKLLAAHHEVEVAETSRRGHATRLAHAAANDGFDVVVVLAGDGTLNEAADGLLHTDTALAPLPGGSTNVYARTLGFSTDAIDATERAAPLARARRDEAHRRRPRESPAVPVQHRHRLRRGGDPPGRALRRAEAPPLAPAPHRGRVRGVLPARGHAHPARDRARHRRGRSRTRASRSSPRPTRTRSSGRMPLHVAPGRRSRPTRWRSPRSGRLDPLTLARRRGVGHAQRAASSRTGAGVDHRHDLHRIMVRSGEPFAYQVDGDDVGDTEQLDIEYEPDALDRRRSVARVRRARAPRARRRERS